MWMNISDFMKIQPAMVFVLFEKGIGGGIEGLTNRRYENASV
jgi:hypothetical protein